MVIKIIYSEKLIDRTIFKLRIASIVICYSNSDIKKLIINDDTFSN